MVNAGIMVLSMNGYTFSILTRSTKKSNEQINNSVSRHNMKGDISMLLKDSQETQEYSFTQRDNVTGIGNQTLKRSDQLLANITDHHVQNMIPERCIKYLSIYTLEVSTFKAWPEYAILEKVFSETKDRKGPYYDNRVIRDNDVPTVFIECPDFMCDIALRTTDDENLLKHSDAIFINFSPWRYRNRMHKISNRLVKTLPENIRLFFYAMENPLMMTYWDSTIEDIQYNYDMTYHSESDVILPYSRYVHGEPTDMQVMNYAENKTDLLVWVASNCNNTFWPRMEWVQDLKKLITFDTYGKCGDKICLPRMSPECTRKQSRYKFTLALENAQCNEYITEKFWVNGLMNGVVPIVYGGKRISYEQVAPPNSFLHVADFSSLEELVNYLLKVDKNDSLYNEFFAWRRQGRVEKIYPELQPKSFCKSLPILSDSTPTPAKRVRDSKYFQSCQGDGHRSFTEEGDINNWTPWK
ncbi:4-galactosyl-N-acetylglucosaminide 3-alpha-L-fucosyltransferase FUT6-like [Lytechinus variegatus]|uniref:4-galactosyl-N-acetylglucosaminide 3-alpha-L-fucosyltransferase FUT6-like n=1 Tax=Lytechinus variegatus TaxID=7654 RepID=UPI001BB20507|nr:4-galactosyl-N-acetylglucosaminide 3-alpha-L-fucosyltransferase FUT6-like [Lytechinus variegatus]